MRLIHNIFELGDRRQELRKRATPQEKLLWEKLRNQKLGFRFKRQYSIGGYILDFYCAKKKLIIELDGEIHNTKEAKEYDAVRDKFFKELEYTTIRFLNEEVENDIEKVLKKIYNEINNGKQ
ncbi:MAG: endonuclease domain-containing protein [Candidatus Paceibacterota bacterium]|jgi:very-short-patch-repair endonuclease